MTGSAGQKRVPKDFFAGNPLPLPPLEEQHRIVAKVDELMALCDQIEQQTEASLSAHTTLVENLLATLTTSANAEELKQNWQRIASHFTTLFTTEACIDILERNILELAGSGKFSSTAPHSINNKVSLLREASEDKVSLLEKGHVRVESIKPIDIPVPYSSIPEGWVLCQLNDVTCCLDHRRKPIKKSDRSEGQVPYYGANGPVGFIGEHLFDEELVLVVEDETFIGRTKPFSYRISGPSWVNNHAHVLKCTSVILPDFLNILLSYYPFIPLTSGTTGRKKLTKNTLLQIPIIVPSVDEQRFIIEKVQSLMAICNQIKAHLQHKQQTHLHLADALVENALA